MTAAPMLMARQRDPGSEQTARQGLYWELRGPIFG
jgi:hypothetical protein